MSQNSSNSSRECLTYSVSQGIWYWLEAEGNSGVQIDLQQSFYVGDAAGRDPNWDGGKRKKDFSCSDRLFALNTGLQFFTPEEYFQKQVATKKYSLPDFNPTEKMSLPLLEPDSAKFTSNEQVFFSSLGTKTSIFFCKDKCYFD